MVKRFLMLALALVVLVGIIGCKKNKPEPETPSSTFTPNATEAAPTSAPVQEEETEPEFPSISDLFGEDFGLEEIELPEEDLSYLLDGTGTPEKAENTEEGNLTEELPSSEDENLTETHPEDSGQLDQNAPTGDDDEQYGATEPGELPDMDIDF